MHGVSQKTCLRIGVCMDMRLGQKPTGYTNTTSSWLAGVHFLSVLGFSAVHGVGSEFGHVLLTQMGGGFRFPGQSRDRRRVRGSFQVEGVRGRRGYLCVVHDH